ncbi:DUF2523 family protein [Alishewanella sp. WH16-1]|uniref:DUF2523 family protein n=1 Tax=Alishewanella sp. WH16-1 TaxID=1651088 RepID=UPI00070C3FAC|nr:DUF2523 family protein [Alishewanella sp. WH16-1]
MPQWLINFGNWLLGILKTMANTIFTMAKDVFFFAFEQIMILITFVLDGMGALFQGLDITQYLTMIPPGTAWVMQQIGLGQALTMIVSAITIRLFLQLVPFTRLGS